jgi:hypothetical protein
VRVDEQERRPDESREQAESGEAGGCPQRRSREVWEKP